MPQQLFNTQNIGSRIKQVRTSCDWTIQILSEKSLVAAPSISSIERGVKNVGLKSMVALADALNVSLDWLVYGTSRPMPLWLDSGDVVEVKTEDADTTNSTSASAGTVDNCANVDGEEEGDSKQRFLSEMASLYDKYMCPPDPRLVAVNNLLSDINEHRDWRGSDGSLWTAVVLFAGQSFTTAGRGKNHSGAVEFSYSLKKSSRTGEPTEELIISTRPTGKTITRSSVELALQRYLEIQQECGYVRGPKAAGQIFGASYLYAVFIKWGVIRSAPPEQPHL